MGRCIATVSIDDVVRRNRKQGRSFAFIADLLGVSPATVYRAAKRVNAPSPVQLRGRWRTGKKGATPAQIIAHAKPSNVIALLKRHGHDTESQQIRTESKKRFWGAA